MASNSAMSDNWEKLSFDDRNSVSSDDGSEPIVLNSEKRSNPDQTLTKNNAATIRKIDALKIIQKLKYPKIRVEMNEMHAEYDPIQKLAEKMLFEKIGHYNADSEPFRKWALRFQSEASKLGFTEEQTIESMSKRIDQAYGLIQYFPKSNFKIFCDSLEGLFVNVKRKELLYKDAHNFINFIRYVLKDLDSELKDSAKITVILSRLPNKFQLLFKEDQLDEETIKMYEFIVWGVQAEFKLNPESCKYCHGRTHSEKECQIVMRSVKFENDKIKSNECLPERNQYKLCDYTSKLIHLYNSNIPLKSEQIHLICAFVLGF